MQSEQWKHMLITGLPKHVEFSENSGDGSNENVIIFKMIVYGVSFMLTVEKRDRDYEFEMKKDSDNVGVVFYRDDSDFTLGGIVKELRMYARRHGCKLIDWQVILADAFIDAGFSWSQTGFISNVGYIRVLLSKSGVNLYFDMVYRRTLMNGNYYELIDTSEQTIRGSRREFGQAIPAVDSIVRSVSRFFVPQPKVGSSRASQSNAVGRTGSVPAITPAGGPSIPQSPNAIQMQLYEVIVDFLIWVRAHKIEDSDAGVLKLLVDIKTGLKQ